MSRQYLALRFDQDSPLGRHGAAWIVSLGGQSDGDECSPLSDECASYTELNTVLKAIEADVAQMRRRARTMFEMRSVEPTD